MGREEAEDKASPRPAQTRCAQSQQAMNEQKPWVPAPALCYLWDLEQGPFFPWGSVSPSPKRGCWITWLILLTLLVDRYLLQQPSWGSAEGYGFCQGCHLWKHITTLNTELPDSGPRFHIHCQNIIFSPKAFIDFYNKIT